MVRKREQSERNGGRFVAEEDPILSKYPLLASYLADTTFETGERRETSTLLLFVEDGVLKGCLNDRQEGMTAWTASNSLDQLLNDFEEGIGGDGLDWRRPKGRQKR